jgi:hypothetical protein
MEMSMLIDVPKAEDIAGLIQLNPDIDTVNIGGSIYKECLARPQAELQKWLYSVLHVGNPALFDSQEDKNGRLDREIADSLDDPWFTVHALNCSSVNNVELSEVSGIRIRRMPEDTGNSVKIPCFRPNLTPGFFMFYHMDIRNKNDEQNLVRYYISTSSPDFAISVWSDAISFLLRNELNFSAKVLSDASSYPRNDAVVFYLLGKNPKFEEMLNGLIQRNPNQERSRQGSPLCHFISSQVTFAEQPKQDGSEEVSFGEHRCGIIAKSIQDSFTTGADFLPLFIARLKQNHVDPLNLSQNL